MKNELQLQATCVALPASNLIRVTSACLAEDKSHRTAIPQQPNNLQYLASIQHTLRRQVQEEGHATIQLVFQGGGRTRVNGLVISLLFPWLVLDEETDTLLLPDHTVRQFR